MPDCTGSPRTATSSRPRSDDERGTPFAVPQGAVAEPEAAHRGYHRVFRPSPGRNLASDVGRGVRLSPGVVDRRSGLFSGRLEFLAFLLLMLVSLLPLVLIRHMVSIDGPSHVLGAYVLAHSKLPVYAQYYRIDLFPTPNLATEMVLSGLIRLLSPTLAEKVLVAGYVLLLPASFRYAVRSVDAEARWLSYLAFPFVWQVLLFYGFYNFSYGLALSLLAVGSVARYRRRWTPGRGLLLAVLLLLTYFTHLLPLLMALLFTGVVVVSDAMQDRRSPRTLAADGLRAALVPVLAVVPVLLLTLLYVTRPSPYPVSPTWMSLPGKLGGLLSLWTPLVTFTPSEAVLAGLLALTLAGLLVVACRRSSSAPPGSGALRLAAMLALTTYLASPSELNVAYGFLNVRLSYFAALLPVLWLAAQRIPARAQQAAAGVAVVVAVALIAVRWPALKHYDRRITEVESTVHVLAPHATFTVVRLSSDSPAHGAWKAPTDPMRHIGSLVAAEVAGVDLAHYEAQLPYFPTQFRPAYQFLARTGSTFYPSEAIRPRTTLLQSRHGIADVRFILVIDPSPARGGTAAARTSSEIVREIELHFDLLMTSRPTGLVRIYVQRNS